MSYKFTVYIPDFSSSVQTAAVEELIPAGDKNFSLTGFGTEGVPVTELEGEVPESIVENKGIYSISPNVECSNVVLNPVFKELVDSVIKN